MLNQFNFKTHDKRFCIMPIDTQNPRMSDLNEIIGYFDFKSVLNRSNITIYPAGASIVNIADYSPFGVQLDGRTVSSDDYRYGFQNQEKDDEIKGEGNSVNYKYRMHDPRVGRFFAVDPLTSKYPWNSPYNFSENVVINAVELEGMEKFTKIKSPIFESDLNEIVNNADILYQGHNSWCGALSAVYLAAVLDPAKFKSNTEDLYNNGFIEGGWFTFDLDASDDLYNESPSDIKSGTGISNTAAFIAASSFKANYLPLNGLGTDLDAGDYDSQFWGITYTEDVVDYLTTFHDITYLEGDGKFDFLNNGVLDAVFWDPVTEIQWLLEDDYKPMLVVDNNMLNGGEGDVQSQHYIILKSFVKNDDNTYTAHFFNPNGGTTSKTYSKEKWEEIINWYGGFKSSDSK